MKLIYIKPDETILGMMRGGDTVRLPDRPHYWIVCSKSGDRDYTKCVNLANGHLIELHDSSIVIPIKLECRPEQESE